MAITTKSFYCVKYVFSNNGKISFLELKLGENGDYAYSDRLIQYRIGRDCFKSKIDAVAKAVDVRNRKIASLRKQIEKLENLNFNIADE